MHGTHLSTSQLRTILERATGLSAEIHKGGGVISPRGKPLLPAACIKFPEDQVFAVDRVNMEVDGENIHLGMWPAEVQTQYTRFYSDPKKVEAVIALADSQGWQVNSNFHIAYWHAQPAHRWYPHLREPAHVRQWIDDFRRGRARARSRQEVEDPSFRRWLVERGYATESELPTLDDWLNDHPTVKQFFIRPGVQVLRIWPLTEKSTRIAKVSSSPKSVRRLIGSCPPSVSRKSRSFGRIPGSRGHPPGRSAMPGLWRARPSRPRRVHVRHAIRSTLANACEEEVDATAMTDPHR